MTHTRTLLLLVILLATCMVPPMSAQSAPQLFQQALSKEQAEGKLQDAIQLYRRIVADPAADRALKARALLQIGRCHEKLGNEGARKAYDDLVRQYPDQADAVTEARRRLVAMSSPAGPSSAATADPVARKLSLPRGAPSPDGQYFAYDQGGDLTIRNVRTGQTRKITKGTPGEEDLEGEFVWTRDSRRIVYNWFYYKREQYDLRIVNVDGSDMKVLVSGAREYLEPLDCSPAGTHAVISFTTAEDGPMQLGVVPLTGGSLRTLKTFPAPGNSQRNAWQDGWPDKAAFSPDGSYIVYSQAARPAGRKSDIFKLPVDGGAESVMVQHAADEHLIGWAPDGRSILFTSDRSGTVDIWLAEVTDGRIQGLPIRIRKDVGPLQSLGLTNAGSLYYQLALTPGATGTEVFLATIDPATGQASSPARPVSQTNHGNNGVPRWSPDGKRLAYKTRSNPNRPPDMITIVSLETGDQAYIRPENFTIWEHMAWLDDGSFVVEGAGPGTGERATAPKGVFRIDAKTGAVTRLVARPLDKPITEARPVDGGRSIVFVSSERALVVADVGTGAERTIFEAGEGLRLGSPAVSPDGKHVAFRLMPRAAGLAAPGQRSFMVIPLAGGTARELTTHQDNQSRWGLIAWSPDGQHVYFVDATGENRELELWRIPAAGGKRHKVGLSMAGNMAALSIHPDGRRIAFHGPYLEPGTWVLENFLPVQRPGR